MHIGQARRRRFQPGAVRSLAADDEGDIVASGQRARRVDHGFKTLFVGDIARIERDDAVIDPPVAAQRRAVRCGRHGHGAPVAQFQRARFRHPLVHQASAHLRRNRGDQCRAVQHRPFDPPGDAGAVPAQQTGGQRRLDLEILKMQPERRLRDPRRAGGGGGRQQRRCNGKHQVGPSARLPGGGCGGTRGEAQMMRDPARAGGIGRDVMRHPPYRHTVFALFGDTVRLAGIGPPLRVIGLSRNHPQFVPARGQPLGQSGRVGPDPDRFGSVVQAHDQQLHGVRAVSLWPRATGNRDRRRRSRIRGRSGASSPARGCGRCPSACAACRLAWTGRFRSGRRIRPPH